MQTKAGTPPPAPTNPWGRAADAVGVAPVDAEVANVEVGLRGVRLVDQQQPVDARGARTSARHGSANRAAPCAKRRHSLQDGFDRTIERLRDRRASRTRMTAT